MPFLNLVLPFLAKYWLHLLGAIAISVTLYKVHDHIGDKREEKVRAEYILKAAKAEEAHKKRLAEKERIIAELNVTIEIESAKAAQKISSLQTEADRLEQILKGIRLTTTRSVPRETSGDCPESRLSPAFSVCWTATVERTPESIAACEAAGLLREVPSPN